MKKPVYEVQVLATFDDGATFRPIRVLTLDDCYEEYDYTPIKPVGYVEVEENEDD